MQKIKEQEAENLKLKLKIDKVLQKLYIPGQDQIIGGMNSTQMPHNVIRGAQQQIEMSGAAVMDAAGEDEQSI